MIHKKALISSLIWALTGLLLLNVFHAFFMYQKEYKPFELQVTLQANFDTWVWYSSKAKNSDSIVLHERSRLLKNSSITVPITVDQHLGTDFLSINWNYASHGALKIEAIGVSSNTKTINPVFPGRYVSYTSDNVAASNNASGNLVLQSEELANGWAMFSMGEFDKLTKIKRFKPFGLWLNLLLFIGLLITIVKGKLPLKIKAFAHLESATLIEKLRFWLMCLWFVLIPFWVISSHIVMALSVALMLIQLRSDKSVFNVKTLVKFVPLFALYVAIIAINFVAGYKDTTQDIADYSYFIFMPLALMGLSNRVVKKLSILFPIVVLLYLGMLTASSIERFFVFEGAMPFKKVFVETLENYWHSSYLAVFAVVGMLLFLLRKNGLAIKLLFAAFVLCFILYSNARLPFILGATVAVWGLAQGLGPKLKKYAAYGAFAIVLTLGALVTFNPKVQQASNNLLLKTDNHDSDARLTLWTAALAVAADSPWLGVGRDNVRTAISERIDSLDTIKFRRYNTHNQYLEFLISYGVIVVGLFLLVLAVPLFKRERSALVVFVLFFALAIMVESYFARQAGVIFFTLWYSFFMLYDRKLLAQT